MGTITKENYNIAASIFRIYLSFHIFKKYFFYFFYKSTLYSNDSFLVQKEDVFFKILNIDSNIIRDNIGIFITLLLILSIMFAFGIGRSITCFLLLLSIEIMQRLNVYILNGGDNLLKFILLYMCFIHSYEYFIYKKSKPLFKQELQQLLSNSGILCIKVHLCIIYFISAISKINSDVWFNGIANYYILSIDRFSTINQDVLFYKNYIVITTTTYITMFWELSFPYLVWMKKMKIYIIFIGILLHLGIYHLMMIHDFEILFISTYILFFTNAEIVNFKNLILKNFNHVQTRYFAKNY
jgi:hypothetical protein